MQSIISRSFVKAEYKALASTTCEFQWLIYLLHDLHISCDKCLVLYCDNYSSFYIAVKLVFHERTKHFKIDCHLAQDKLTSSLMKLIFVSSSHQLCSPNP